MRMPRKHRADWTDFERYNLDLAPSQTILVPNLKFFNRIEDEGDRLTESTPIKLKHNQDLRRYAI
ncbi:MAG: hypothetical protein MGF17_03850 [Trichodesmium sp. MAG_R04]|nr:hypothetical protein [Trichodesmium sp. MAG_R04]